MKKMNYFLYSFFLILVFTSCADDPDLDSDQNFVNCTLDTQTFEREGIYAYATPNLAETSYSIYGAGTGNGTGDMAATIYITIPKMTSIGSNDFVNDVIFAYVVDHNSGSYSTNNGNGNGTINISLIDEERIEGTFSFEAYSFDDPNEPASVQGGNFSVGIR